MKLFTIGDSISQGFMSGAAARTDLCYSTLIAQVMQLSGYRYPDNWKLGGLPINMEKILRRLAEKYKSNINGFDWVTLAFMLEGMLDEVEDYYEGRSQPESGDHQVPDPSGAESFHNIAVQGFDVADAWLITPKVCREAIQQMNQKDKREGFLATPSAPFYRTALKVLNPSLNPAFDDFSQLSWLEKHAKEEGIENVILWLGGNNALGTVFGLEIKQTPNDPAQPLLNLTHEERDRWNLWHPNDFEAEYQHLLDRVDQSMQLNQAQDWNVLIGTVPLVTIPPLTKGVGPTTTIKGKLDFEKLVNDGVAEEVITEGESVYYKYYTYFFRDEAAIAKSDRAYLTMAEVIHIDDCIREYNRIIRRLVAEKNSQNQRNCYHIVDLSKALQKIAFKRNAGQVQYDFPPFFDYQSPGVNTKYYHADAQGRLRQGGLFSLDGIHPSAIGQGLIAHEFLKVMKQVGVVRQDVELDFQQIFASDTLYSNPITIMQELYENQRLAEFLIEIYTKGYSQKKK